MVEIQLNSYPKHKVKLYEKDKLRETIEVDDGLEVLKELTEDKNPFDNIKLQKKLNLACELFKPKNIKIKEVK